MHPIFFVAAAVVGLPVLLHLLLRQQPKRLIFPALRFLKLRQKSSQRKVQLRHILLMALRVLLLALFAAALYQPDPVSFTFLPSTDKHPVAAVLILDTSPSMGYGVPKPNAGPKEPLETRLDEARRRAAELLNLLPANSKVAVLATHDPTGDFQPSVFEAHERLKAHTQPSGSAAPLSDSLRRAYTLLAGVDRDAAAGAEPTHKLIAVFGDQALGSWNARDTPGLVSQRDRVPQPAPAHVFFDLGIDKDKVVNLAVTDVRMESDRLTAAADAVLTASIRADGLTVNDLEVKATLDDGKPEPQLLKLASGTTQPVRFTFKALAPGFHTVLVKLGRDDALPFDNERTFTFEVQPRRAILAVADDPRDVTFWRDSHNFGPRQFQCKVVKPTDLPALGEFEMVAVIAVDDPEPMKDSLKVYVEGGGKLLLAPDGPGSTDSRKATYAKLGDLMPCELGDIVSLRKPAEKGREFGAGWKVSDEADLRHRLFAPAREWSRDVDFFTQPNKVEKARALKDPPKESVVAYYDDSDDPAARTPAVVEKTYKQGKVLLLTTRIDNSSADSTNYWNDYWDSGRSWPVLFPWLLTKYLTDPEVPVQSAEAGTKRAYNFATGDALELKIPLAGFAAAGDRKVRLEGPGVTAERSKFTVPADVGVLTIKHKPVPLPVRVNDEGKEEPVPPPPGEWWIEGAPFRSAGAFAVKPDGVESPWQHRFSLATPAAESDLTKTPPESIAEVFGPDRVIKVDQAIPLDDLLKGRFPPSFEPFYPLILLVLIFFAAEAVMANRFYKMK